MIKNLYLINSNVPYAENDKSEPVCVSRGCHETKVITTLIGLNFCDKHFSQFYSPEPMKYDRWEDASNYAALKEEK